MPRLIAAKSYPALVDVYFEEVTQNPITGETVRKWIYDQPMTFRCNYMSLSGHAESYQKTYFERMDDVRVEVGPDDAQQIRMGMRFGNLRNANDPEENYYRWVGKRQDGDPYYFTISAIHPKVDGSGRIQFVEMTGKLAGYA